MKLYEVESASGITYVRAPSMKAAEAYAAATFQNYSGIREAATNNPMPLGGSRVGAGIFAVDANGNGRAVGTLNTDNDFARLIDMGNNAELTFDSFANNIAQDPSFMSAPVNMPANLGAPGAAGDGGPGGDFGSTNENVGNTDGISLTDFAGIGSGYKPDTDPAWANPVAGFLHGLGFSPGSGYDWDIPGAGFRFIRNMAGSAPGVAAAQNFADFYRGMMGQGGLNAEDTLAFTPTTFGQRLSGMTNLGREGYKGDFRKGMTGLGQLGLQALGSLGYLGGLGSDVGTGDTAARKFVNPLTSSELESGDIASLVTSALTGAGLSPYFSGPVYASDINDLYTRYVGLNPQSFGSGAITDTEAGNFLNFVRGHYGLDKFPSPF